MIRALVNGYPASTVAIDDRGLNYGDGVFETLRVVAGRLPLWDRHLARLQLGCQRLGFAAPDAAVLRGEAQALIDGQADAVLKIICTRGSGGRGYAAPTLASGSRILSLHALPQPPAGERGGIAVRWCRMPLATQPALAQIKHLNRLEQVLARNESNDERYADGLMCDSDDNVVCATAANLFALIDDVVVTPLVEKCGVAGVARGVLIERGIGGRNVQVRAVQRDELDEADEVFLTNAVRGVLPVTRIAARDYALGACARAAAGELLALGLPGGMPHPVVDQ